MTRWIALPVPVDVTPWRMGEVPRLEPIRKVPDPYNWGYRGSREMKKFDDSPPWERERMRLELSRGDPI